MDALTALLRHIKLEPLIQTTPTPQTTGKALTETPVPAAAASADTESHADVTHPSANSTNLTRATTQTRLAATAENLFKQHASDTETPDASAFTRLSAGASLLGKAIHSAQQSGAPLPTLLALDVAHDIPEQVAQRLNTSLSQSGLFYEAHLQEWASGSRSLASLHAEPHNRLVLHTGSANAGKADAVSDSGSASTVPARPLEEAVKSNALALPEALQPVVREQLHTLDLQRVLWQGEVWPNQLAELEVAPEQHGKDQEDKAPTQWQSTLRIDLPELGQIVASIVFSEDGARVSLRASMQAIEALREGSDQFRGALDAAGIPLRQLDISSAEKSEDV
ncbi:MAG TPA: flagellar hook-length control protein FliK [Burkholderiales bacterium]|nr:flagellar hook-length control protein FliK [Burkholderiales bacterium]